MTSFRLVGLFLLGACASCGGRSRLLPSAADWGITVSPDPQAIVLGHTAQMKATGTYKNGTTQDLTQQVTWSVAGPPIITVSNDAGTAGQVTGIDAGSTTVVATLSGISGKATVNVAGPKLPALIVTPASAAVTAGVEQAFTANGRYEDGTTSDLTTQAVWTSSDEAVARISNLSGSSGVATTLAAGTTTIEASFRGMSGTATLTVGEPLLSALIIVPDSASIAVGEIVLFSMTVVYANGTLSVANGEWTSSNPAVATLAPQEASSQVVATGVAAGTTTITLTYQGLSASARLTVTADRRE